MSTLEIKGEMYELISKVNDKEVLMELYELIGDFITQNLSETDFWDELSKDQKDELERAIQESNNDENLIEHKLVVEKYSKWLKR